MKDEGRRGKREMNDESKRVDLRQRTKDFALRSPRLAIA